MATKRNDVDPDTTTLRTSFSIPRWMDRRLQEIVARTLSSRSQVIRRLLADALDRESSEPSRVA